MKNFYKASLRCLYSDLQNADLSINDKKVISQLLESCAKYDIKKSEYLVTQPYIVGTKKIERDIKNPTHISLDEKIGHEWADDFNNPLLDGEKWNYGRRATFSGFFYHNDKDGNPIYPYGLKLGVTGPGNYGHISVNPTVSNGILKRNDNSRMNVIGIIRKNNGLPALSGGYIDFPKKLISREERDIEIASTQTKEFFEEMLSGSINLSPAYQAIAKNRINFKVERLKEKRKSRYVGIKEIRKIEQQEITATKLKQIQETSKGVMDKVHDLFAESPRVYFGPHVSSSYNTKHAWAENHLSVIEINPKIWQDIIGNTKELSTLSAGDDAADVFEAEITPELVLNCSGSNGVYMAYSLASFICNTTDITPEIKKSLINQCGELIAGFESAKTFKADTKIVKTLKQPNLSL